MAISIVLHISNEEPIVCEIENLPDPSDQIIVVHNPRRRDGKDIHYLDDEVNTMIVPWHRVNFIQVRPQADVEEVITFVRE
ncbi:MAG: hypothetical protein R3300_17045 [Candidatus Promineifilaceae bacterium]|nr:hypothetical protein [Candidatus Promineifilaceae bacterium]